MAAQTPVKVWLKRLTIWPLTALTAVILLYLIGAWIGSSIPRNSNWSEPETGVDIIIETNGLHTSIVMPLVTPEKDWRTDFPVQHTQASNRPYTHISVSWGEREVFLTAEDWADLRPAAAWGAIIGGDALLHVAHYVRPAPSDDHRIMTISPEEYRRLVDSIEPFVIPLEDQEPIPGYTEYDVFYEAPGTYTAFMTCNQWTADRLADAGIKTAWWSPFAGGVMQHVPRPQDAD